MISTSFSLARLIVAFTLVLVMTGCGKPSPDEIFQEATDLMGQQNFVSARHRFQEIVDNYPDFEFRAHAKVSIGDCYLIDGQPGKARAVFQEVADENPGTLIASLAQVRLGHIAKEEGRWDDAVKHYNDVIASATSTELLAETYNNLAESYIRGGKVKQGIETLESMVQKAKDPASQLRSAQTLANYFISQGTPESAWTAMTSIKDSTLLTENAQDPYFLSVRQTAEATRKFEEGFEFFKERVQGATDENKLSRALYNEAMLASATSIYRATAVQLFEKIAADFPKSRYGRWAEVDAAKTILMATEEFENPKERAFEYLGKALDNYDDIINDATLEWFEPHRTANARFQVATIWELRGQWLENVDDLRAASAEYSELARRFETEPQISQQALQHLNRLAYMVEIAEASPEEFWGQVRMIRAGIDPNAKAAEGEVPSATGAEGAAAEVPQDSTQEATQGDG